MKYQKVRKVISFITSFSLVLQTFLPLTFAAPAYAEDTASDSAIMETTPTPEVTPEITPTDESTPEVTPETTPTTETTPEVSVTPEITPEATPSVEITPEATIPAEFPPVETVLSDETSITPTETPIIAPEEQTPQETTAPPAETPNQPTVTTDKADYAPTDTVQVAGMFFLADTPYVSTITSEDAGGYSNSTNIITDPTGAFFYLNQLDGTYRPNYSINVTDSTNTVIASTTFLDHLSLCGNGTIDSGEECDGSNLGGLSATDFKCKSNCDLELIEPKINICHATDSQTNPYNEESPNKTADVGGHSKDTGSIWYSGIDDHSWGDIIPPFNYIGGSFSGLNWPEGKDILNNACEMPLSCGETEIYEKSTDFSNLAVNIDFEESDYQITVTENSGYKIKNIWLDVHDDPYDGYHLYATGPITDFNPTPGRDIRSVKVEVTKECSPVCGNSIVESGETCDNGTDNTSSCTAPYNGSCNYCDPTTCQSGTIIGSKCGDNVKDPEEACDDGNTNDTDACSNTCSINPGTVSGTKFNDLNGNGTKDSDEPGILGWHINLWQNDSAYADVSTDANGNYTFTNVPPGTYLICESSLDGWQQTYPVNTSCQSGKGHEITVSAGEQITNKDFGNHRDTGTLRVLKNVDLNGDGDYNEIGEEGATDWLWQIDGGADHHTGDEAITLPTGTYHLTETNKADFHQVGLSCTPLFSVDGSDVRISKDSTVVCTFENAHDTGSISFFKDVVGGSAVAGDWTFAVYTDPIELVGDTYKSGSTYSFLTGNYTVIESLVPDYSLTNASGVCSLNSTGGINMSVSTIGGTCRIENTYVPYCGDGVVNQDSESCDDGNSDNGDGCSDKCKLEIKVDICHATPPSTAAEGWNLDQDVNEHSIIGGEGHDGHAADIIPAFDGYAGKNLTTIFDGATGQEILDNGCLIPEPDCGTNQYLGNDNECHDKTPVCNDDLAINYERITDQTYADNSKCEYEQVTPSLTISRSNNASSPLNPGSSVEHTITINVLGNSVTGLTLTDILPNGFTFSGSYTVLLNGEPITITAPEYNSPGVWNLGNFNADDEIIIKYTANISSEELPGIYDDLAYAFSNDGSIVAKGQNSEFVDGNFVGTDVEVIKDQTNGGTYEVEKKVEGEVLGASTTLPATGASPIWLMVAFVSLVYGIRLIKSSNKNK